MKKTIKGSCHCKAVKFELTLPTEFCSHCHCESCRRLHGSAFVTWTSIPERQFNYLVGDQEVCVYESSPGIEWLSCRKCHSHLFQKTTHSKNRIYISLSCLDEKIDRKPDSHVSYEERVDWFCVNDDLPKYKEKASSLI
jgi:hypothetical protein